MLIKELNQSLLYMLSLFYAPLLHVLHALLFVPAEE